jgi:uncharacterized protein (UPF0261 family)
MTRPKVAIVGTCDTKWDALIFIKRAIVAGGQCDALVIDIGEYDPLSDAEIDIVRPVLVDPPEDVVGSSGSRAAKTKAMIGHLTSKLSELYKNGMIKGVIGAGGSTNTSICTAAFRNAFPIGFPKLMVSTMASGDVSCYVGETDITMMYSVVDVAGLNSTLEVILRNAACAIAGMTVNHATVQICTSSRPAIAVSMFGVTTPCVQIAMSKLEELGYDVVVFHATGAGGRGMERLISEGKFIGVLDLTTTELADELVGGVLTAGPHRLEAAAKAGIPQVVSVGAMDMVNFGPRSSIPDKFTGRLFHEHNTSVTLMRTTREEASMLGEIVAKKANLAVETTHIILPLGGFSLIDVKGAPFWDPEADEALLDALRKNAKCKVEQVNAAINDTEFALAAVEALVNMVRGAHDV